MSKNCLFLLGEVEIKFYGENKKVRLNQIKYFNIQHNLGEHVTIKGLLYNFYNYISLEI